MLWCRLAVSAETLFMRGHHQTSKITRPLTAGAPWPPLSRRQAMCPTPLLPGATLVPRRSVTTGTAGWYEGLADSSAVHLTEGLLVSAQSATGLPWWASIAVTTVALRTVITLPLGVYQSLIIAKVEALQVEIAQLAKRLHYEVSVRTKEKGWTQKTARYQFKKNLRRIVSELYVRENCHPFKASLLVWVQLPMWVCVTLALRNLSLGAAHSPPVYEDLAVGGALWFSDLTLPDSTWLLPISLGLVNLLITEIFALRRIQASKFQRYVTHFIRGISLLMVPIAATVPSSMAVYWLSSSVIGLGHNLLVCSPRFRRLCRLPPTRVDSDTPYRDLAAAFVSKYLK
ncbi:cytochrome c oxidase assembly protein COX18, mitochondrial [Denticeps clupeoides]|uniref:Membrane insertase YidC/Oxa/ALB C-terminal domain-containing protein n=1 Tax=Denticeps clupeoides TaxID=299321 RepID=A0AAY4E8D4_9TELE|nr:cytochrome c oxidase assembly protein COX18, mitochondrial [Denticeps clupeoides]XP_028816243.1 cytochrome c oxidase assembly protein COX18, mitochondrial [Denticeps clupeoides]